MKSNKETKYFVDKIIIFAAIFEPMFVLPQVYTIFRHQNAEGVSILTWLGLTVLTAIWVRYAYVHKEKMVLLYQSLFLCFNAFVIIGALLFGGAWI